MSTFCLVFSWSIFYFESFELNEIKRSTPHSHYGYGTCQARTMSCSGDEDSGGVLGGEDLTTPPWTRA